MNSTIELIGRLLLGHIFVMTGISKLGESYAGTAVYMDSVGIPGGLLPLVIALEIGAGLMVIAGFKTKWGGYALAAFSIGAALVFHSNFDDQMQSILFMINISMAGGLLLLSAQGAGAYSLDRKLSK